MKRKARLRYLVQKYGGRIKTVNLRLVKFRYVEFDDIVKIVFDGRKIRNVYVKHCFFPDYFDEETRRIRRALRKASSFLKEVKEDENVQYKVRRRHRKVQSR